MKKLYLLIIILSIILSSCSYFSNDIINSCSDEEIYVDNSCCDDKDGNGLCDFNIFTLLENTSINEDNANFYLYKNYSHGYSIEYLEKNGVIRLIFAYLGEEKIEINKDNLRLYNDNSEIDCNFLEIRNVDVPGNNKEVASIDNKQTLGIEFDCKELLKVNNKKIGDEVPLNFDMSYNYNNKIISEKHFLNIVITNNLDKEKLTEIQIIDNSFKNIIVNLNSGKIYEAFLPNKKSEIDALFSSGRYEYEESIKNLKIFVEKTFPNYSQSLDRNDIIDYEIKIVKEICDVNGICNNSYEVETKTINLSISKYEGEYYLNVPK